VTFRAYADNVVVQLEPEATETASGIAMVRTSKRGEARRARTARVIASGKGYAKESGVFVANEVQPGQRVLVDSLSGQNYDFDLTIPRHNKSAQFQELFGDKGEFRIVRHDEILGVVEEGVQVG
jgi:co-chaperonin GroES (HSP10)